MIRPVSDPVCSVASGEAAYSRTHEEFLRDQFERAKDQYGTFKTTFEQFVGHVLQLCSQRASQEEGADLSQVFQSTHLTDIYLAQSMALGDPRAWTCFDDMFQRLLSAASSRLTTLIGATEQARQDLLGDLFLPGRPGGPSRILTYNGTASLARWVVMVLRHRIVDLLRRLGPRGEACVSLDEPDETGEVIEVPDTAAGDAVLEAFEERLLDGRKQSMLRDTVPRAFRELTAKDRILLKMRYLDGVSQNAMASTFHVDKSRVSRWLERAYRTVMKSVIEQLTREHGLDFKDATELVQYAARTEFGGEIERLLLAPTIEQRGPFE